MSSCWDDLGSITHGTGRLAERRSETPVARWKVFARVNFDADPWCHGVILSIFAEVIGKRQIVGRQARVG